MRAGRQKKNEEQHPKVVNPRTSNLAYTKLRWIVVFIKSNKKAK
jgi:hypothetical protein